LDKALETDPAEVLRYGGWLGYERLRAVTARRQSRLEGMSLGPENFVIHNGSSGSIDNVCSALLDPGDVVIVERPSFSGTVRTIRGHMADIVEAPMTDEGVSVAEVANAMDRAESEGKRVKFLYTIPDFHNPTGATMPLERRRELIELCSERRILIVEDAAYTEIYFGDSPPQSIYSLAGGHGVLRLGSYSKVIATGLRVGWVQARADYIGALTRIRFDMGNSPLFHKAVAIYIESGKLEEHVANRRANYADKCDVLCESLHKHCEPHVRFKKPEGGFFLWLDCMDVSATELVKAAVEEGLIFPPGSRFFCGGDMADDSHARLAFSYAPVDALAGVGKRLKAAFHRINSR
jgi:2-aminoadipate transaminase